MNQEYWENKIRYFLHDPVDKALSIPGHETRAKLIADAFGVSTPSHDELGKADIAASGLDRAALPGYDKDESKNGAINFTDAPFLTHPISSANNQIKIDFKSINANEVTSEIVKIINDDTKDKKWSKQQYFQYLFFTLRKSLITKNAGGLGFLWSQLPADTRIPDHSIWNHNAMVSAFASCYKSENSKGVSLVAFSITPVQSFIEKTRKLSDHHSASVILSWLCAEGLIKISELLGPDHVLYPSLQGQPLIDQYFKNELGLNKIYEAFDEDCKVKLDSSIASLPNKFVFLCPTGTEADICKQLEEQIQKRWLSLSKEIVGYLLTKGAKSGHFEDIFKRQTANFWNFQWASNKVLTVGDRNDFEKLMGQKRFAEAFNTIEAFTKQFVNADLVYGPSHSLLQTLLATGKSTPICNRAPEPGEKCPICGEFEVIHNHNNAGQNSASDYNEDIRLFYKGLCFDQSIMRKGENKNKYEKLCSICLIKRLARMALKTGDNSELKLLKSALKNKEFPSTTEMATYELFERLERKGHSLTNEQRNEFWDTFHNSDNDEIKPLLRKYGLKSDFEIDESDKYYAILAMDGDKMGDLVNGNTISAKWGTVIHPHLSSKMKDGTLKNAMMSKFLDKKRALSPALHSTISEALGYFSIYAVSNIVKKNAGHLIYAGGDDVLAVLPLSKAVNAAHEIQKAYNLNFATLNENNDFEEAKTFNSKQPTFRFLGKGEGVSISAAVLICHHKDPLQGVLSEVKDMLKAEAKEKGGRNSLVVRLKKRSGQIRDFLTKWDDAPKIAEKLNSRLACFEYITYACSEKILSGSLIYRLSNLKIPVESCLASKTVKKPNEIVRNQIIDLYKYEIEHSGDADVKKALKKNKDIEVNRLAEALAEIMIFQHGDKQDFNETVPIIANYLARGGM